MHLLLAIVEFVCIIVAAYGLGIIFIKNLNNRSQAIYAIGIGVLFISLITFVASAIGFLNLGLFLGVLTIGMGLAVLNYLKRGIVNPIRDSYTPLLILSPFFIINLFFSMFPPTFYDSLLYHLAIPQYYLMNGGMTFWPNNFLSNMPLNVEMIYLFSFLGKTVYLPKLLSLISSIGIVMLLVHITSYFIKTKLKFLPAILVFTLPQFGFLASSSKIDIISFFFMLAGISLLIDSIMIENKRYFLFSGIFLGAALGSKYIFAFYIVAVFIAYLLIVEGSFKEKILVVIKLGLIISITMLPWFIKNIHYTGNPVYPYLRSIFNSSKSEDIGHKHFIDNIKRGGGHSVLTYLLYPVNMFISPYKYDLTGSYGVLFLFALPFLFFSGRKKYILFLTLSGAIAYLVLLPFSFVSRFFLFSLIILSIPIAKGVDRLRQRIMPYRKVLISLGLLLLSFNFMFQITLQEEFFKSFLYTRLYFKNTQKPYLYILPHYKAIEFVNRNLKESDTVMFLGEDRTFYMKRNYISGSHYDPHVLITWIKEGESNERIIDHLKRLGVTHILFSPSGLIRMGLTSKNLFLNDSEKENLYQMLNQQVEIYQDYYTRVYRIE